jgi:hypothetical protein
MNEEQFVDFLSNKTTFFDTLKFDESCGTEINGWPRKYNKNLCILYHIAFFEDCIPKEFTELYLAV